jgi:hypothetical protein
MGLSDSLGGMGFVPQPSLQYSDEIDNLSPIWKDGISENSTLDSRVFDGCGSFKVTKYYKKVGSSVNNVV